MSIFLRGVGVSLVLGGAMIAGAQPLEADPRVVAGSLDNGLSYLVMRHEKPPGRAGVWMHISSGSLNETEEQRGVAHFLEHMAFNGSENFPPGSVIDYFQSLGLTFGRHQNAFTSFDQTTYQLSLPDASPETVDKAMLFFSDVLMRLSLLPEEIDEERQIILEEKTARKSGRQRVGEYLLERLAPGSTLGRRLPIGTEETIRGFTPQQFRDYWTTWYTPANTTLIVVADADPAAMIDLIRARFTTDTKAPRPIDREAGIVPYAESFGVVASDPELTRATVSIQSIAPAAEPTTTRAHLRQRMLEQMAQTAFNRRLDAKIAAGTLKVQNAQGGSVDQARIVRVNQVSASGDAAQWSSMLEALALETRRATQFGFSAKEVADARTAILTQLERAAINDKSLPAQAYLMRLNLSVASGDTFMNAGERHAMAAALMSEITPEDVSSWFATAFAFDKACVIAQLPAGPNLPCESDVLAAGLKALAQEPQREEASGEVVALLDTLPAPGTWTTQSTHEGAAVWSGLLSNGVRMHHKAMDYRKDSVTIAVTLLGGSLGETAANRGITEAASVALNQPATTRLTSTQIRDLMIDKKVSFNGRAGADALQLVVGGTPESIEAGLELIHALLTGARIEETAFGQWKARATQGIEASLKNPQMAFPRVLAETIVPAGETRLRPLSVEQVNALTREASQAWLDGLLMNSPIEVAVVGDMDRERAMELVAKYIGSIPAREPAQAGHNADKRLVPRPVGPLATERSIDSTTQVAWVMSGFFGPDQAQVDDVRALALASRILSTRMVHEIREKAQLVYSIGARVQPGTTYFGYGTFSSSSSTQPEKAAALADKIREMFDAFAKDGVTPEELEVAKRQTANSLDEAMKEPSFWQSRLETLVYDGVGLDAAVNEAAAYQVITAEQIVNTFRRYDTPDARVRVIVRPSGDTTTP